MLYSYKLQIRADLKDTLNCAAILQNIICPIEQDVEIEWFQKLSPASLLTDHNMFWKYVHVLEAQQMRLSQRTLIDKIAIARAIMPVISPFVA